MGPSKVLLDDVLHKVVGEELVFGGVPRLHANLLSGL